MSLISKLFGGFSPRGKAMAMYKSGMHKAGQRNLEGAISDYTKVIEMKSAPEDIVAMALHNRALAYSRSHDDDKAIEDLERVLEMPGATKQILDAVREKMHRMKRRVARSE